MINLPTVARSSVAEAWGSCLFRGTRNQHRRFPGRGPQFQHTYCPLQSEELPMNIAAKTSNVRTAAIVAGWILAALAAAYVLIAHRAHALEWLPFALLLACPLMHIFIHRNHGRHDRSK